MPADVAGFNSYMEKHLEPSRPHFTDVRTKDDVQLTRLEQSWASEAVGNNPPLTRSSPASDL